jgi:hypothetical protein
MVFDGLESPTFCDANCLSIHFRFARVMRAGRKKVSGKLLAGSLDAARRRPPRQLV